MPRAAVSCVSSSRHREAAARTARHVFALVDEASDQPIADLLAQCLDGPEKTAWRLRRLLEE